MNAMQDFTLYNRPRLSGLHAVGKKAPILAPVLIKMGTSRATYTRIRGCYKSVIIDYPKRDIESCPFCLREQVFVLALSGYYSFFNEFVSGQLQLRVNAMPTIVGKKLTL